MKFYIRYRTPGMPPCSAGPYERAELVDNLADIRGYSGVSDVELIPENEVKGLRMKTESTPGAINTWTGKKFFPATAEGEIDILDIAHALSNQCRYAGHCHFYSVAEHSVLLAASCDSVTDARYALLHDASEAYLVDIPRPLKALPEFRPYLELETRLQTRIYREFGLDPHGVPVAVTILDRDCIAREARALIPRRFPEWVLSDDPDGLARAPAGLSPDVAEELFIKYFVGLWVKAATSGGSDTDRLEAARVVLRLGWGTR
jgi:hypothetical protein